jgi:phosphatidate phosphatase APP1
MKNLILILVLLISFSTFAQVSIISDLDDTIKITQAGGNATDIIGDDVFTGMPEFFKSASRYSDSLYILSASPSFMGSKIRSTLRLRGIQFKELILRSNVFEDKFTYKVREIKRILDQTRDDFILVGDDLGKDPEVYAEITRLYPSRILSSYIHKVNGRSFKGSVTYWTSLDLFLREFEASRMPAKEVETIFDVLGSEKDLEMIFPLKANCPTDDSIWDWQIRTMFQQEAQRLIIKFTNFCKARQRRSDNF